MPRGSDWRGRRRGGRQIAAPAATLGPLALQRRKERADDRQTLEDAHVRPRDGSTPSTDTVLAAVNLAAMVYTVRNVFARCRLLTEACRHLLETLRGRAFPPGPGRLHRRQEPGPPGASAHRAAGRPPVPGAGPAHLHRRLRLARPLLDRRHRREPPRAATQHERARVASLAVQNTIRAARTAPVPARDGARPRPHRPPPTPSITTTTKRRPRRTASTTQTRTPPSPRRSGPRPSTPTSRLRCRNCWKAARPIRRRRRVRGEPCPVRRVQARS